MRYQIFCKLCADNRRNFATQFKFFYPVGNAAGDDIRPERIFPFADFFLTEYQRDADIQVTYLLFCFGPEARRHVLEQQLVFEYVGIDQRQAFTLQFQYGCRTKCTVGGLKAPVQQLIHRLTHGIGHFSVLP